MQETSVEEWRSQTGKGRQSIHCLQQCSSIDKSCLKWGLGAVPIQAPYVTECTDYSCDQFYLILSRINRIFFLLTQSHYTNSTSFWAELIEFFSHSLKIITFNWKLRANSWMEKLYWYLNATRAAWYKNSFLTTSLDVLKRKVQVCLS